MFREAVRNCISSNMPAKSLELRHTIKLIQELTSGINKIQCEIKAIMDEINSPILTILGINYNRDAMIIAEIGNSIVLTQPIKYLPLPECLHLLINLDNWITVIPIWKSVVPAIFDTLFTTLLNLSVIVISCQETSRGKHYNVVLSHATNKLVRTIYAMEKSRQTYRIAA